MADAKLPKDPRAAKLAAALRVNLRRRKAAAAPERPPEALATLEDGADRG